ncbi:hypothetical protein EV11_0448 [Prochlorococcus sp. SS52]|nr:hypothetical protein EV11_0448 [Prochlorococcus sp. SS52]
MLIFGGYSIFSYADKALSKFILKVRPDLENKLSDQWGRTLIIGPYKGLRPWGFAVGPSKLLQGVEDDSSVDISSLKIQIAPVASLLNWKPVVIFSPSKAKIFLKTNENGAHFVLGKTKGGKANNFDLIIRLDQSSGILLDSSKEEIKTKANAFIKLVDKKIKGSVSLSFPDKGELFLKGGGYLNTLSFRGKARFKNFNLESFQSTIFNRYNFLARGRVNANIRVGVKEEDINCAGGIRFDGLNLRFASLDSRTLVSKSTSIRCRNKTIEMPNSKFKYGLWSADLRAYMPIKKKAAYKLNLLSSIHSESDINSPLNIEATLPIGFNKSGLSYGELFAQLDLNGFSLSSLTSLIGTSMSGSLSTSGTISGPISSLTSNLSVELDKPQISSVRLQEKWQGNFKGSPGGGGELSMTSVGAAVPGTLKAKLKENWSLDQLVLKRLGGVISLENKKDIYSWQAKNFRLDRLEVAIPPVRSFNRVFGTLIGEGTLKTAPLFVDGEIKYRYPRLLGVRLKEAVLKGTYSEAKYSLSGELIPPDTGKISINANGKIGGPIKANAIAKGISPTWLTDSSLTISKFNLSPEVALGTAKNLNGLFLASPKDSLDSQLINWDISRVFVERYKRKISSKEIINPSDLQGNLNAEANLEGSKISKLNLEVKASGKIWIKGDKQSEEKIEPFTASFKSLSLTDKGEFKILNLPFSILSLFFTSPSSLTGMFGVVGRYKYNDNLPELSADLVLNKAKISEKEFVLDKANIVLSNSILNTDISIREVSSLQPVKIVGKVPLSNDLPFDVKVESHGDGLTFLDGLSKDFVNWKSGTADLKLIISGTRSKPVANGYFVVSNGEFLLKQNPVKDFDTKIIFDFNQIDFQTLTARIGDKGVVKANGGMYIFRDDKEISKELNLVIKSIEFDQNNFDFKVSSNLNVKGSILQPLLGGDITIEQGSISTKRSRVDKKNSTSTQKISTNSTQRYFNQLPEQNWDYKDPLVLFIEDKNSPANKLLRSGLPKGLSFIGFDSLKLRLGPDLRIVSQPIASFDAAGTLILDGALDDTLDLRGLIRLRKGRVNLFTTTFALDTREPNIALFAPSMGLIPYLDITMTTRVPDVIQDPTKLDSTSDFASNGSGAVGIGGSRFVKVELVATGPADRVSETFQLRSTPALPKSQLLDLIGGNSLTMLMSGSEREVLVDFLNRSFLSPALGNLSGAFSERIQVSLYPAFVTANDIANDESENSEVNELTDSEASADDLSPQQAWIAEVGFDLSQRVNFSIQTTPNRKDIPPQGTITFQINPSVGVLGALDKNGNWQSQVQIFVRY